MEVKYHLIFEIFSGHNNNNKYGKLIITRERTAVFCVDSIAYDSNLIGKEFQPEI